VVSVAGTWLAAAGSHNRPLRSDLDGLHHPLLGRRHSVIDWELMRRSYDYGYRSNGDYEYDIKENVHSTDTRLRLGVRHGLTDRVQISGDGYWHPPFRMTGVSRVASTWWGTTTVHTTDSSTRYQALFGWRLNGTWRVNQQGELFLEGTSEQQGVATDTPSRPGPVETSRTTTIRFGGTWLSRRSMRSVPLTADVAGLYHPLVEPRQIKVDGLVDRLGYRGDRFVPTAWLWRVQATTGIWSSLQATVYGGMMFVDRSGPATIPDRYKSMGAELRLRPLARAEVFSSVHLHPAGVFNTYPVFILGRDDPYHAYHDFLSNDFGGDRAFHIGLRLVL